MDAVPATSMQCWLQLIFALDVSARYVALSEKSYTRKCRYQQKKLTYGTCVVFSALTRTKNIFSLLIELENLQIIATIRHSFSSCRYTKLPYHLFYKDASRVQNCENLYAFSEQIRTSLSRSTRRVLSEFGNNNREIPCRIPRNFSAILNLHTRGLFDFYTSRNPNKLC